MTRPENRLGLAKNIPAFYESYPTAAHRLSAARQMATGISGLSSYHGRNTLAGHWGDTPEQYEDLAHYLDDIKYGADATIGQAALIFRQGSPAAVKLDAAGVDSIIEGPITVDCGYIAKEKFINSTGFTWVASVRHARGGDREADRQRAERRGRTYVPHLALGVGVLLTQPRTLTADLWTATLTDPAPEAKEAYAYTAVLSTQGDVDTYQAARRTVRRPFIFGNTDVKAFLDNLRTVIECHDASRSRQTVERIDSFLNGPRPIAAILSSAQKTA